MDLATRYKDVGRDQLQYDILRTGNLAKELIAGWDMGVDLGGYDRALIADALDHYGEKLEAGEVEAQSDEATRLALQYFCEDTAVDIRPSHDKDHLIYIGWAETQFAARALVAFVSWLQVRLDEAPPELADAA